MVYWNLNASLSSQHYLKYYKVTWKKLSIVFYIVTRNEGIISDKHVTKLRNLCWTLIIFWCSIGKWGYLGHESYIALCCFPFYPFNATGLFLHILQTSKNKRFSDIFRGYRERLVAWKWLLMTKWPDTVMLHWLTLLQWHILLFR